MNKKFVYLAAALMISGLSMAQKKELKDAEKAVKKGNVVEANAALQAVESVLGQANNEQKIQFYYLKSNLAFQQIEKNQDFDANVDRMVAAYKEIAAIDKNNKFAKQANEELGTVASKVINKAIEENNSSNYKGATKKFKQAFDINPQDTLYLYYAASTAISSKDYPTATAYYKQLIDLGYKGNESYYTAVEKATGEVQNFGKDSKMRDVLVKQGSHTDPKFVKEESKRPEIVKNLALIYYQEGQYDQAEKAIIEARKANPDDTNLMLTQMDLYLKSNNMGKYEEIAKEALSKNPNDDVLLYNLGVTSYQAGKADEARKYYEKAIQINPKNENAYLNMAFLKLQPDEELTNKMNSLGMSAADNKKYEQLQKEKKAIYRDAMNDLEKVLAINPQNEEAIQTLKNIYRALEMNDKLKALEAK
ncbi:tetratricopeptide repeat protein [Myroides sp. 1354]|uniref:tetratricopeptide repeat protein n=1 Tax=unclassified Myroides TaxID=2642485 RepID=UPI00257582DA|nr:MULTISPECIES: tetratricopeptide repeat protein [unclassified Myroides]MDM1046413.1 tetratricopeptide repeat protein [Myroides sp. R163-1]MDM1057350.1 tetratricopeptide repeat protein [Myroides sp. 1354]MDM1070637.1 tetratricopeptide repeat protein [Myroides sp. 1372]